MDEIIMTEVKSNLLLTILSIEIARSSNTAFIAFNSWISLRQISVRQACRNLGLK